MIMFGDEGISTRRPHGFRDTSARSLDDEVSASSVDGRSGNASEGFDTGDMWAARSDDHEGTCGERSCASVCLDTAASNDQPNDTMAEREEFVQDAGRVSAFAEAVLGTPLVGTRVFLLQQRNVTDEVIAEYIANQSHDRDDDFKVDG